MLVLCICFVFRTCSVSPLVLRPTRTVNCATGSKEASVKKKALVAVRCFSKPEQRQGCNILEGQPGREGAVACGKS